MAKKEAKKITEKDIVFPWDLTKFKGDATTKAIIWEKLDGLKFPIKKLRTKPPEAVRKGIIRALIHLTHSEKKPIVVVVSKSYGFLQALALYVGPTYSFTRVGVPCNRTNTEELHSLFSARAPADIFAADPAWETRELIRKAGLLVWEDVADMQLNSYGKGMAASMLSDRCVKGGLTLMTTTFKGKTFQRAGLSELFKDLERMLGDAVARRINEFGFAVPFDVEGYKEFSLKVTEKL